MIRTLRSVVDPAALAIVAVAENLTGLRATGKLPA